jgi:hypothetical protein
MPKVGVVGLGSGLCPMLGNFPSCMVLYIYGTRMVHVRTGKAADYLVS